MAQKLLQETFAIAQRVLIELCRRKRSLVFWSIFPVILLVLNSLILEERTQLSRSAAFAEATAPSLVGAALFFSCLGGSVATVVAEREQQTLKRLFLSPLSGVAYFLGIFVAHAAIGLGQTLQVWVIAVSMGADFKGNEVLALLIILLSIAAYVGIGFTLGTQFARRTEDVNALIAAFGVPLLLLGGAFLPTSLFPKTLLTLAKYNPIYHMIQALAGSLTQPDGLDAIASHLWFLVLFAPAMTLVGWFAYRRALQTERQL